MRKPKSHLFVFLVNSILFTSANAQAPDWTDITELKELFDASEDLSYQTSAMQRCSALFALLSAMMERDGHAEIASNMEDSSLMQGLLASFSASMKRSANGGDADLDLEKATIEFASSATFRTLAKSYGDWISWLQATNGDFMTEPRFYSEYQTCQKWTSEATNSLKSIADPTGN